METTGPFGGLFKNLKNMQLAETWIDVRGVDHEFTSAEFSEESGVIMGSAVRVLNQLVEKGIITCYANPKNRNQMLYRIAWPVTVTKKPSPVPKEALDLHQVTYPDTATPEVYHVRLFYGDNQLCVLMVEAGSPVDAAQLARASIKAHVSQEWEF